MSGFSVICSTGTRPAVLLDLLVGRLAGRQSATAAVATKSWCRAASGSTASNICCAL
jgi:hypothetical protein